VRFLLSFSKVLLKVRKNPKQENLKISKKKKKP
jgi:hypothetical protein